YGEDAPGTDLGDGQNPERFTGHEKVADSNGYDLYYMHARYQMPRKGRFLTVDPALGKPSAPGSWNRYLYGDANPILKSDPTGKIAIVDDAVIIGGFALVAVSTAILQSPSPAVPGKTNGQVLVETTIGGFQALGRAIGSMLPGKQPTSLP